VRVTVDFTATLPRKRMAAGALLTGEGGRVLLVEPTYKPVWEIPGGTVEADESPRDGLIRELGEELGMTIKPGRLLVVDWVAPHPPRSEGLMLVFDGGTLTEAEAATIRLPADELHSWAWCTEEEITHRTSELLSRRILAAARARTAGTVLYLENGHPVQ
jgi:8-oxo-dGTP diphosphatase